MVAASTNTQAMPRRSARRRMLLAVVTALLVSLLVLLAGAKPSQAIVGGTVVQNNTTYPFIVQVLYKEQFVCTGTLIDKDSVLTAAHCLYDKARRVDAKDFSVIVGTTKLEDNSQGQVRDVSESLICCDRKHRYNDLTKRLGGPYDAAVLNLTQPVNFSKNVRPIELAPVNDNTWEEPGRQPTVAGWGITSNCTPKTDPKCTPSGSLREVEVPVRKGVFIEDFYNPFFYNRKLMIGAGGKGEGVCEGDSGGPLFSKHKNGHYMQIGITSAGYPDTGCGSLNTPDIYTEVNSPAIRGFITRAMKDTSQGGVAKPPKENPPKENPPKENPPKKNPPKQEPPKDQQPPTEQQPPPTEQPPTEQPPTEQPPFPGS
jgi:secreted trypsin-like serine protease